MKMNKNDDRVWVCSIFQEDLINTYESLDVIPSTINKPMIDDR
jgi:hypothetical protein